MYDYCYDDITTDDGFRLRIMADQMPENPRQMCDPLGTLAIHRTVEWSLGEEDYGSRYGDRASDAFDHLEDIDIRVLIPLQIQDYGSSGAMVYIDTPIIGQRACRAAIRNLDESDNAYLYLTAERMREEYGNTTMPMCRKVAEYLVAEITETKCYVEQNTWGWIVDAPEGTGIESESCWGYYCDPTGYVREAADEALADLRERVAEEMAEREAMACRDIVTV